MVDGGAPVYDTIGVGYGGVRRPEPRIARRLLAALGDASRVLNVGAGAGSYEPTDRAVVAVEPSSQMIDQRPVGSAPALRAVAQALPFADGAFDGALALLTVHHWPDPVAGLAEVRRVVAGPVVVFTFDARVHVEQWLVADYLPAIGQLDTHLPTPEAIAAALGGGRVEVLAVPHDCRDGFLHAYWRRPDAYLDPAARAGISGIARQPTEDVERAMAQLRSDLDDGTWHARHLDLLDREEIDAGYRLVVAPG
jgi:SAM-dependent methyltransferase